MQNIYIYYLLSIIYLLSLFTSIEKAQVSGQLRIEACIIQTMIKGYFKNFILQLKAILNYVI